MTSRRQFLALGMGGVLSGLSGCSSVVWGRTDVTFESWRPDDGSWPLPFYDLQNIGSNPSASPPSNDATVVWSTETDGHNWGHLVADDHTILYGEGARLLTLGKSQQRWNEGGHVYTAAFGPPAPDSERSLYVALQSADEEKATVVALDVTKDETTERFRTVIDSQRIASLVPTETALFVGRSETEMLVLDPKTGDRLDEMYGRQGAISDGALVTTMDTRITAHRAEPAGTISSGEITTDWTAAEQDTRGRLFHPAIADGRVLLGSYGGPGMTGHLHCFDVTSGATLWEPRSFGWATTTPSIEGSVGYVCGSNPGEGTGRIAAVSIDDGTLLWERETDWEPFEPVAADGTVLVRRDDPAGERAAGYIEAIDGETGETQWSATFENRVTTVRPVGNVVYVGTGKRLSVLGSAK